MASFAESGLVIGLTGGIASGKSTAARYLASLGAHVIDADALGHRAYQPDTDAYRAVLATFGEEVRGDDGQLDRKALGGKVFGNPQAMKRLTDIMWPEIRRLAEVEIAAVRDTDPRAVVVLEAAVLFEAGWQDAVDETWVVTADRDVALARAMTRDGLDRSAVQARMDAQLSNAKRSALADLVVDNSGTEAAMRSRLDDEWARVTSAGANGS
ncbi:MAG: dephospho-CoA kinase [Gammaproteobacteria bacterium]|nr:dephospho-CoA kinase [Gammaproteobacteria bacterium]